ncbi:MAG TPA: hypothetical protein VIK25_13525 [Gemmatimonadaceae bacterium]
MRVRRTMMVVGAVMVAASATAQAQCATGTTEDACYKTIDIFNFLTPQISTALVGGSTTLGQGGVLGGFPHFALALRATAVKGTIPDVKNVAFNTGGFQNTTYTGKDQFVPMASVDGAIGIFKGFPLGVTRVGGLDLLATATYIPKLPDGGGQVTMTLPGGSTKFGGGVRLGLLQESLLVPGVSFSWIKRDLPTLSAAGTSTVSASGSSAPGSFAMNDLSLKTTSWRISVSKSFLIFGLQAGLGQDKYDNSAALRVTVTPPAPLAEQTVNINAANTMTRTNMYVGFSLNFFIGKLVAEAGQVSGGTLPAAHNTFGSDAAASRGYFSVGLRTGF